MSLTKPLEHVERELFALFAEQVPRDDVAYPQITIRTGPLAYRTLMSDPQIHGYVHTGADRLVVRIGGCEVLESPVLPEDAVAFFYAGLEYALHVTSLAGLRVCPALYPLVVKFNEQNGRA